MASRYVGGPCDGQIVKTPFYSTLSCGNVNYVAGEDGNYHPASGAYNQAPLFGEPQLYHAWTRLLKTVGVKAPRQMTATRALGKRMRRVVR